MVVDALSILPPSLKKTLRDPKTLLLSVKFRLEMWDVIVLIIASKLTILKHNVNKLFYSFDILPRNGDNLIKTWRS